MNKRILCAALMLLACPLQGAAPAVARVAGTEVSSTELQVLLPLLQTEEWQMLSQQPAAATQLVKKLLLQQVLLQQAQADHWSDNPQAARAMQRARDQALVESYLQAVSQVPDDYPRATELEAYYAKHSEALRVPRRLQLAQIFIQDTGEHGVEKLKQVTAQLELGADTFASVAQSYSDDTVTAQRGGELGWVAADQVIPELRAVVAALEAGETTAPVRSAQGWHILHCREVEAARYLQLEEVREALIQRMRGEREAANRAAYLQRLAREHPIAINELELEKIIAAELKDS